MKRKGSIYLQYLVNGKWSCIFIALFQSTDHSNPFTILATFTHSRTHSYTDGGGYHTRHQLLIRSNLGFSILLKDTLTCSWKEPGFEPPTFRLLDKPLYLLTYSRTLHEYNISEYSSLHSTTGCFMVWVGGSVISCFILKFYPQVSCFTSPFCLFSHPNSVVTCVRSVNNPLCI